MTWRTKKIALERDATMATAWLSYQGRGSAAPYGCADAEQRRC